MAKTTIKNQRAVARSGKNQPNRGLKRRFDLSNKKVRFITVIVLIAVIGGGWLTLKSFAVVGTVRTYTVGNGLKISSSPSCTHKIHQDATKGSTAVGVLACPGTRGDGSASIVASVGDAVLGSGKRRACFVVKGEGSIGANIFYVHIRGDVFPVLGGNEVLPTELAKINASGYTNVCTPWATAPKDTSAYPQIFLNNNKSGIITVSSIRIEHDTNVTNPQPAK